MIHAILLLAVPLLQEGQDPDPAAPAETSWELELLPAKSIYLPYLADPRQPRTSTKVTLPVRTGKGTMKIENCLGSQRALALWKNPRDPDEEAELYIEAAVFSRFDLGEDWDMDGADYRFGFPFAYRYGGVAVKLHLWHLTSHLGDEYMTRLKTLDRASYHNDELALGVSWQATPHLRAYGEIGYGIYTGPATDEGRVQVGFEAVGGQPLAGGVPFAAVDLSTRKEIDWDWNLCVQMGLLYRSKAGGSGFRFLGEYYRGHDQQTQFKSARDHTLALGVSAEF